MLVTKLLISPVKKRIFCPKATKFGPKLAFLVNLGQAMQAYSVPCWWLWRGLYLARHLFTLFSQLTQQLLALPDDEMMSSIHGKTASFFSCKTNLNHPHRDFNIANWPGGRSIGPWWGVSSPSSRDLLSFPTRTTTCNSTATWSLVRFSQLTYLCMSELVGEPDHTPLQVGNWSYDTGQKDKPKKKKS